MKSPHPIHFLLLLAASLTIFTVDTARAADNCPDALPADPQQLKEQFPPAKLAACVLDLHSQIVELQKRLDDLVKQPLAREIVQQGMKYGTKSIVFQDEDHGDRFIEFSADQGGNS